MAQIICTLLENKNISRKEAEEFEEKVRERKVAEMFRYLKSLDVQALRKEADERERKAWEKASEEGIIKAIKMLKAVSVIKETAKSQLMAQYDLDEAEADKKIALYW